MKVKESMKRWVITAFIIYSILSFVGATISYIGEKISVNSDGIQIIANIITSTQGFFTGILGYGDFFEYSGFYIIPFILGALVWILVAIFLCYITRNKASKEDKLEYIGIILMLLGCLLCIMSLIVTIIYQLFTHNEFAPLLFVFLAVIFIPLFISGLLLFILSKFSNESY
ncbi:MAG: hypothetical protein ABFD18_14725 [Syntrophomonas sp.]